MRERDEVERLAREAERRYYQMRTKQGLYNQRAVRRALAGEKGIRRGLQDREAIIDALARALAAGERRALMRLRDGEGGER